MTKYGLKMETSVGRMRLGLENRVVKELLGEVCSASQETSWKKYKLRQNDYET